MLCLAAAVLTGCESDAGGDDNLKKALERRAAERTPQAAVSVGAIRHGPSAEGGSRGPPYQFELDKGGTIEVREAYIVVAAVELHACEPGRDNYETPDGPLLNSVGDLLVPAARAHVASSSNRFGTPFVEELTGSFDRAQILGEIAPPLAAYCRVAAIVAPADPDVVNSTGLSTESVVGSSVLVRGRRRSSPDDEWTSFEWTSDAAKAFEFPARDPRSGDTPLVLDSPDDEVMLLIDKTVGRETLAVDPDGEDPAADLLQNVGETIRVHVY